MFQLVSEGLGSTEIAQRMTLSIRTVDVYRASIMKKLEIKNQAD